MRDKEIDMRRLMVARRVILGESYKAVGKDMGVSASRVFQLTDVGMRIAKQFLGEEYRFHSAAHARENPSVWIEAIDKAVLKINGRSL